MLKSNKKTTVKKNLLQFLLLGFIASTLSFDTPPETLSPYASGVPVTAKVENDDAVKRFMTAASDSVLTILNGNLWMLPGELSTDKEQRIDLFVAYVHQLMPHVITLQEIWTRDMVAHLKTRFPEFDVYASGGDGFLNKGGLVTLTRTPASSSSFTAFAVAEQASALEKRAGKGYLTVRLNTAAFNTSIVNTHLYAPTKEHEQAFAEAQFKTLKNLDLQGDYFIVGDLNMAQETFEQLNGSFFLTEQDTAHTVDPANKYRSRGANGHLNTAKNENSYKVDRFLMPQACAKRFAVKSMLIRKPVVSDHYLLAYRIEHQLAHIAASTSE